MVGTVKILSREGDTALATYDTDVEATLLEADAIIRKHVATRGQAAFATETPTSRPTQILPSDNIPELLRKATEVILIAPMVGG